MVNTTGQRLLVVTEEDGEVLFGIKPGESLNIRTEKQTENDKFFALNIKVQITGNFIKNMDKERELIDALREYPSTYMALNIMKQYLVKDYNVLLKENKKYKIVDLARDMGITRQGAAAHINKLKELDVVAEIDTNKGKLFCINPYYYYRGKHVSKAVVDLFDKKR